MKAHLIDTNLMVPRFYKHILFAIDFKFCHETLIRAGFQFAAYLIKKAESERFLINFITGLENENIAHNKQLLPFFHFCLACLR